MPATETVVETKAAGDATAAAAATATIAADAKATAGTVETAKVATETKVADATAAKVEAAAELKLVLPKGAAIDQARVDDIAAFAKANGIPQAAAEKLLERENASAAAIVARDTAALAEARASWIAATAADKTLAGEDGKALVATKEIAMKAVNRFGDDAFRKLLADTSFGEHPIVLAFLKRIGDGMGEDTIARVNTAAAGASRDPASVLYPSMKG